MTELKHDLFKTLDFPSIVQLPTPTALRADPDPRHTPCKTRSLPACAQELDLAPLVLPAADNPPTAQIKTASKTGMNFTLQIKCRFRCTRSETQFSLLSHPGKGWLYSQVSSREELCSLETKTTLQADQAAAATAALLWHLVNDNATGEKNHFVKGRILFHRKR